MSPPSAALAAPKLGRFKAPVILSHPQICGRSAVELRASSPAAGNGIFGCGDRAPKIVTKLRQRSQRPKSGKSVAENPRKNALFGVTSETRGLQGLDGVTKNATCGPKFGILPKWEFRLASANPPPESANGWGGRIRTLNRWIRSQHMPLHKSNFLAQK
jgi:hypothetical protein